MDHRGTADEMEDDELIVMYDETDGMFGNIRTKTEATTDTDCICDDIEELLNGTKDDTAIVVETPKMKHGFVIKKKITGPACSSLMTHAVSTRSSTATSATPMDMFMTVTTTPKPVLVPVQAEQTKTPGAMLIWDDDFIIPTTSFNPGTLKEWKKEALLHPELHNLEAFDKICTQTKTTGPRPQNLVETRSDAFLDARRIIEKRMGSTVRSRLGPPVVPNTSRQQSPSRSHRSRSPPRRGRSRSPPRRRKSRSPPRRRKSRSPPGRRKSKSPPRRGGSKPPPRHPRSRSPPRHQSRSESGYTPQRPRSPRPNIPTTSTLHGRNNSTGQRSNVSAASTMHGRLASRPLWSKRTDEQKRIDKQQKRKLDRTETQAILRNLGHVPELNRHWISRPYQWFPNENNYSEQEEEVDDLYAREQIVKWAKADQAWRQVFHTDKTAREYADWSISDRIPVLMPIVTLQQARDRVNSHYFVDHYPKQLVYQYLEGAPNTSTDPVIQGFCDEVRNFRFMSFDTEGNGQLPRKSDQQKNRLFVAFSSPQSGTILLFHDAEDVPSNLRQLLIDYTVAKLQSGIGGDVKLMKDAGLIVRGVVDSGTLFMLIKPGPIEAGFGAKRQLEAIWPNKNCHVKYSWFEFNKAFEMQELTPNSLRHVMQDVLTPFATLFTAAIKHARYLACRESNDIMPLINEALELTYTKDPKDVRARITETDTDRLWIPQLDGSEFKLNSRAEMTLIRRARGDFVERFSDEISMDERRQIAQKIWSAHAIPSQNDKTFRGSNWCLKLSQLCQNCGEFHNTMNCQDKFESCPVKHYATIPHPPHSALMCPQLHSFCPLCKLRGHLEQDHAQLYKSPMQLRQDFRRYCHLGLYTSLPFLYTHDGDIKNVHWKSTLHSTTIYRGQGDMWMYCGLDCRLPQKMINTKKARKHLAEKNLQSTPETYEFAPCETKPKP